MISKSLFELAAETVISGCNPAVYLHNIQPTDKVKTQKEIDYELEIKKRRAKIEEDQKQSQQKSSYKV